MLKLTINDVEYSFNFNIAFMRTMNKQHKEEAKEIFGENARANAGLAVAMMAVFIDDDIDELINILYEANSGMDPRIKKGTLESYIDDDATDMEGLVAEVKNSLLSRNATKKEMQKVENLLEDLKKNEE